MRKYIIFSILNCYLISLFGQSPNVEKEVMFISPPTPEIASLVRFTDFPAANYTGIPSIEIPIYEINTGDFKLPITLQYHAKGIFVSEQASNVGLGWILNAGGAITRTIRSIPDDYKCTDCNQYRGEKGRFWANKDSNIQNFKTSTDYRTIYDQLEYILNTDNNTRKTDLEADIFHITCGGISGKFLFDIKENNTQEAVLIPYQDIVIHHSFNNDGWLNSFTIIDSDGTKYFFTDLESCDEQSYISWYTQSFRVGKETPITDEANDIKDRNNYPISWYLSKIITSNRSEIIFEYENERFYNTNRGNTKARAADSSSPSSLSKLGTMYSTSEITYSKKKRLKKITTPKEQIYFEATHEREDLRAKSYAINSIIITDIEKKQIKKFVMNYSYFISKKSDEKYKTARNPNNFYDSTYLYRLKLDSLTEDGVGKYNFGYDVSNLLPDKLSSQVDYWGFFNGADNNKYDIPSFYIYPNRHITERFSFFKYPGTEKFLYASYDDRNPNPEKITAGMLTSITNPAGGKTKYEYESNTFQYKNMEILGGGVRIKSIKKYNNGTLTPCLEKHYKYTLENGKSSGKILTIPIFFEWQYSYLSNDYEVDAQSKSLSNLETTNGGYIGYTQVTIFDKGDDAIREKSVFTYAVPGSYDDYVNTEDFYEKPKVETVYHDPKSPKEGMSGYHVAPFPSSPIYDWAQGLLLNEEYYSQNEKLLKKINYKYKTYAFNMKNVYGITYRTHKEFYSNYFDLYINFAKTNDIGNIAKVLSSREEKTYSSNSELPIVEMTQYTYGSTSKKIVKEDRIVGNKTFSTEYNYVTFKDEQVGLKYKVLKPIEITNYYKTANEQNKIQSSILYEYDITNKYSKPLKAVFELTHGKDSFKKAFYDLDFLRYDENYKKKLTINKHTRYHEPLSTTSKDGINTIYLWSYSGRYLVAEIKNATEEEVNNALKTNFIITTPDPMIPAQPLTVETLPHFPCNKEFELKLRNGTLQKYLPNALVTTYTHKPLVGILTATDPMGITTYYEYDSFGRLTRTYIKEKDEKGLYVEKIIQAYEYNYSNK